MVSVVSNRLVWLVGRQVLERLSKLYIRSKKVLNRLLLLLDLIGEYDLLVAL